MITFHNTLSGQKETLVPLAKHHVRMYHCGPTVYGFAHIGNFRSFLFADLLRRFLEFEGYEVTQVMNITDVGHLTDDDFERGEDKVLAQARLEGLSAFDIARKYETAFLEDSRRLALLEPHHRPRATEHVREMLVMIQELLDRGHAYLSQGEAYYDVKSFPRYGRLSGNSVEDLVAGARVAPHEHKRHAADFALWKTDERHLMQWDPHDDALWQGWKGAKPKLDDGLRRGFPGWHLECSAMAAKYLGESFDIHTGGEDNIFPHHECEIAQSEGATDRPFVRLWMHARHLQVNGRKMSKRDGTFLRVRDVLDVLGYDPQVLRYELIGAQYRQPLNFHIGEEAEALLKTVNAEGQDFAHEMARRRLDIRPANLERARQSLARLQNFVDRQGERAASAPEPSPSTPSGRKAPPPERSEAEALCQAADQRFREALSDDLNIAGALAAVFDFTTDVNRKERSPREAAQALDQMRRFDRVFGVLAFERADEPIDAEVAALAQRRQQARSARDFAAADTLRREIHARGYQIEDKPDGSQRLTRRR